MRKLRLTRSAVILFAMSASVEASGTFSILYFAAAATFTGKTAEQLPAPLRVRDLFAKLNDVYPGMQEKVLSSCALTVNLEYVDLEDGDATGADQEIKAGDEVAIIPPVSSG
jgi:molybdopterin converting factor small subunit